MVKKAFVRLNKPKETQFMAVEAKSSSTDMK